jgi:hypothetical protein
MSMTTPVAGFVDARYVHPVCMFMELAIMEDMVKVKVMDTAKVIIIT